MAFSIIIKGGALICLCATLFPCYICCVDGPPRLFEFESNKRLMLDFFENKLHAAIEFCRTHTELTSNLFHRGIALYTSFFGVAETTSFGNPIKNYERRS